MNIQSLQVKPRYLKVLPSFSLVETLVAISILLIAIVGPFYSIQKAITGGYVARDQLIAAALSQEAIEYVYMVRNNNFLVGNAGALGTPHSWLLGVDVACTVAQGCTYDPGIALNLPDVTSCSAGGCAPLNLNTTNNTYTQAVGNPVTPFTRTVKIVSLSSYEVNVLVSVTWKTFGSNYTVTTNETLYNWL